MAITLKAARVNANLTQEKAARLIGVSKDTLKNWEHYKSFPSVDKIEIMLKVYNLNYDDLTFLPSNYALSVPTTEN